METETPKQPTKPTSEKPKWDRLAFDRACWHKRENGVNAALPNGLFNDLDAREILTYEKPVHRRMAEMAAQGYTHKEIGEFTGYTPHYVSNVLRQPHMREHTLKTIKQTVQDEMKEFLEGEVLPSLRVLKEVRDSETVKPSDKITASTALLDRFLGKPTQPISTGAKPPAEMSDEELREQVQRELTASQPN